MMEGYKIYRWKKQNFMPAEDMIFYFWGIILWNSTR
jgi:hypothetical protein